MVIVRTGITGAILSARGLMSGPMPSGSGNYGLSLASLPVRWKPSSCPPKSFLRQISVQKPPRDQTERLVLLPFFALAAETWARTVMLWNIYSRCAVGVSSPRSWKNTSNTPLRLSRENGFQAVF